MNSGCCFSCIGEFLRPGAAIGRLGGLAICVVSLVMAAPEVRAQGIDPAIASAEAPMVNSPSADWGQPSRIAASSSEASSAAGGGGNIDRQSSSSDTAARAASGTEAKSGSAAPMDPSPADDIAVATAPTALPVVQRSAGKSASSGSTAAAAAPSAAEASTIPAGDYDGPPQ